MHSAATQSALHFHVTQILIENPRQHLTTQPVGNIQHRFLSRHFAPTRHIVPFSVLGWDILILLKKIACHCETNPFRSDHETVVEPPFAYHLTLSEARHNRIIRQTRLDELPVDLQTRDQDTDDPKIGHDQVRMILEKVKDVQDKKNSEQPLPGNVPHMAIAICKDKEAANHAVEMWNAHFGDRSAIGFHSGMRKQQLLKMKKKIENNKVKLVVVVAMLQEGFDHPPISIAAIMTKIVSPVKFVQFIGRAQRIVRRGGHKESPDIRADITTHVSYQQKENYLKFESENFIDISEA